jgi:tripartite-type tricarboxylate transporter receptor subunit TctC
MFQQSLNAIRRNFMQLNNKMVIFRSVLAALLFLPLISIAQSYPNRPMKIIAPFPAGGTSDLISRIVAQRLGESLGQSIIVENRPGANGTIGLDAAAKAPADGYTLLICSNGVVLKSPLLYNKNIGRAHV